MPFKKEFLGILEAAEKKAEVAIRAVGQRGSTGCSKSGTARLGKNLYTRWTNSRSAGKAVRRVGIGC